MNLTPENLEHLQAVALQVIGVLTLLMPALEKIADMTATKVDNEILALVGKLLTFVPRIRLGDKNP